jgi:hypothetical protein
MLKFNDNPEDEKLIQEIATRAAKKGLERVGTMMDISATHASGCPLKLKELSQADDLNFFHDVCGINRHLNRRTGQLKDCFVPRFAL